MRKSIVFACALALASTSCASIVSKSDWPVNFVSPQPGLEFSVRNDKGTLVAQAKTPTVLVLSSREGYFAGADYTVETSLGVSPLRSKLNGWYFGNIVFGGLLGLLIVDPATGAMWRLPEQAQLGMVEPAKPARPAAED